LWLSDGHLSSIAGIKKIKQQTVVTASTAWKTRNSVIVKTVPATRLSFLFIEPKPAFP
jgi:hypothetical protein